MPTEIKAWSCRFKCNKHVTTVKARMVSHESRCGKNPGNHTCATCAHDYTERDCADDGYTAVTYTGCLLELRPVGKLIIYMCDSWQPKHDYGNTGDDAAQIKHEDSVSIADTDCSF